MQRLINSCVVSPITLRVNSVDMTHGGLSSDVTVVTRVVTSNTRFVRFLHSSHTKDALLDTLRSISEPPVLIFVNSIGAIESLVVQLRQEQFHVCGIHSEYPQELRSAVVRAFREGGVDVLVCASLLERGIDFDVDEVILYEVPDTIEKVKHRAGRTGRGGNKGRVTVFITKECKIMKEYKRLLKDAHLVLYL